jgi:hypothetical protein
MNMFVRRKLALLNLISFKVFTMYSQRKLFYIWIAITKYTWTMYSTISKIIPAQKITVNILVLNLVVKMHNVRSWNYYKVDFNFSLEIIQLKLARFRSNTPIGNWAQAISTVQAGNCQPHRTSTNRYCGPTGPTEDRQGPSISYLRTTGPHRDPIGPPKGQVPDHHKVRSDK